MDIAHKYYNVGGCNGNLCLISHLLQNSIVALGLDTTRVNEKKTAVVPLCLRINTVTGNAGSILYY